MRLTTLCARSSEIRSRQKENVLASQHKLLVTRFERRTEGAALGALFGVMVGALVEMGGFSSFAQVNGFLAMSFPPIPQTATQRMTRSALM